MIISNLYMLINIRFIMIEYNCFSVKVNYKLFLGLIKCVLIGMCELLVVIICLFLLV